MADLRERGSQSAVPGDESWGGQACAHRRIGYTRRRLDLAGMARRARRAAGLIRRRGVRSDGEASDLWDRHDAAQLARLHVARNRCVFVEREMGPRSFVVVHVRVQDAAGSGFAKDDDVVQAFPLIAFHLLTGEVRWTRVFPGGGARILPAPAGTLVIAYRSTSEILDEYGRPVR